jgi:hypothetical protein
MLLALHFTPKQLSNATNNNIVSLFLYEASTYTQTVHCWLDTNSNYVHTQQQKYLECAILMFTLVRLFLDQTAHYVSIFDHALHKSVITNILQQATSIKVA